MNVVRIRLVLDANLSPETAEYLRSLGFLDTVSLIEERLWDLEDDEVVSFAIRERRTIITFDLDFAEAYYFSSPKRFSAIVLRLFDQRIERVNVVLRRFFSEYEEEITRRPFLAVVSETSVRLVR